MFKKMRNFFYLQLLLVLMIIGGVCAQENDDDDLDLDALVEWEQVHVGSSNGRLTQPPFTLIAQKLSEIIKAPLWKSTRSSHGRNLLYLFPSKMTDQDEDLQVSYFYNLTTNLQASLSNLIDLENSLNREKVLELLEQILSIGFPSVACQTSPEEIFGLLPLFSKISVWQHKSGIFLRKRFERGPFEIIIHGAPFEFIARHVWLPLADREITDDLGNRFFPGQKLNQNEFVRFRYGPSDTRIQVGVNTVDAPRMKSYFGVSAIIPTGRIGHKTRLSPVNLNSDDFVGALSAAGKNMRDYFLDASLGNGGYFSAGIYLNTKIVVIKELADFYCNIFYDKSFAFQEDRLYAYKKTLQPSDLADLSDEAEALQLLKKFFPEYLTPLPFRTKIQPGGIFNATLGLKFGVNRWRYTWGYDFYHQAAEEIKAIYNTDEVAKLRILDAKMNATSQHKIFWQTDYLIPRKKVDLHIGWGADWTVRSKGLGHDMTTYINLAAHF